MDAREAVRLEDSGELTERPHVHEWIGASGAHQRLAALRFQKVHVGRVEWCARPIVVPEQNAIGIVRGLTWSLTLRPPGVATIGNGIGIGIGIGGGGDRPSRSAAITDESHP